jgi:voltage-gated potassium channel
VSASPAPAAAGEPDRALRQRLRALYFGTTPQAARFQHALLVFDVSTVGFFLIVSFVHEAGWIVAVDLAITLVLAS